MRSRIPGLGALALPAAIIAGVCGLATAAPAQAEAAANAASSTPGHVATNQTAPLRIEATGPNLLTAGSFEQSTAGWQRLVPSGGIVNWANYNTAAGAPAPAHDGTGYLAFNTNTAGGSVFQDVPVTLGTGGVYEASVWLSSQSGSASGTFCLWSLGSSNTDLCSAYNVDSATGYQNYVLVFGVPQQTGALRFQVYPTANGGTTDMDTASLNRIG
ncbi:hypothetical protein OG455_39835 [Kitasatospora sp. NBC_01287]|uniref:hypothetical protein n=1 Tax=Kitasatospora sp. NBC_01287 TaxID=2903573 RepID=UPI00225A581A|nr:hypothetical protein [Kitasatospora sp. NBC_01287]MCX4751588.1 hypothetical protein [Kitasatospora sp. NBC_01287]